MGETFEDQQNPHLIDELSTELAGIFNWAYRGLRKLLVCGQFVEPARCIQAIADYRRDTNPARVFLEENYTQLDAASSLLDNYQQSAEGIPCSEVYQAYLSWCQQNGYHPLNANNFGKEVKRTFPQTVRSRQRNQSERIWLYTGLKKLL